MQPAELENLVESEDLAGDLALVRDVCGVEAARKLAVHFGGVALYISCSALQAARIRMARKLMQEEGWSCSRAAAFLGVTSRWLQRNVSAGTAVPGQMEIFNDQ